MLEDVELSREVTFPVMFKIPELLPHPHELEVIEPEQVLHDEGNVRITPTPLLIGVTQDLPLFRLFVPNLGVRMV